MPTIAKIETFTNQFVCFVKVTTDEGDTGWGQTAPYHADITAQVVHRQIAPWSLGEDALDIDQPVALASPLHEAAVVEETVEDDPRSDLEPVMAPEPAVEG